MKIIKQPSPVRKTCNICGCIFDYDFCDTLLCSGGTRHGNPLNPYRAVKCPYCKELLKITNNRENPNPNYVPPPSKKVNLK